MGDLPRRRKAGPTIWVSANRVELQSRIGQISLPRFPNTVKVNADEVNPSSNHENDYLLVFSVSPDGKIVVSCFGEMSLKARSVDLSALPEHRTIHHPDGTGKVKVSPDSTSVYLLTSQGTLLS